MANTNSNIQLAIMKLAVLNSWLKQRKCHLMIIGTILLVIVLCGLVMNSTSHMAMTLNKTSKNNNLSNNETTFITQLNVIQAKLNTIEQALYSQNNKAAVDTLSQKIVTENQRIVTQNANNTQQIMVTLSSQIHDIQLQLSSLSQAVTSLQHSTNPTVYLDKNALPFKVISIDNIQQQDVVTVEYNYKNIPLLKDYRIAGWQLINANYISQQAEFVNLRQQHVKVTLPTNNIKTEGVGYA